MLGGYTVSVHIGQGDGCRCRCACTACMHLMRVGHGLLAGGKGLRIAVHLDGELPLLPLEPLHQLQGLLQLCLQQAPRLWTQEHVPDMMGVLKREKACGGRQPWKQLWGDTTDHRVISGRACSSCPRQTAHACG